MEDKQNNIGRRDFIKTSLLSFPSILIPFTIKPKCFKSDNSDNIANNNTIEHIVLDFKEDKKYNYNENDEKKYRTWIDETIGLSKKKNVVIVDKSEYRLDVYKNKELILSFPVELGRNPYDDKKMQGDCCTPEGKYKVDIKKNIGNTNFYKAFLIDYPNSIDIREFRKWKQEGIIPSNARIGGMIEIHGHGSGKAGNKGGRNWTLGCIALSNKQMDELFKYVFTNTPVTIVRYGLRDYK